MSSSSKFVRSSGLIGADVDNDLIMLNAERGEYFGISGVGKRIWELIEQPITIGQLVERVVDEYDVDSDTCSEDTRVFLSQMLGAGLVEEVHKDSG